MKALLLAGTMLGTMSVGAWAADTIRPLAVTPQAAFNAVSGYSSLYLGFGHYFEADDGDNYAGSFLALGGNARTNVWLSPNFSIQSDVEAEATTNGFTDCCESYDHRVQGIVGVHASWRSMQALFGGFVGASGNYNLDGEGAALHTLVGLEGQFYYGNITLYGQIGMTANTDAASYGQDMTFGRVQARFFATQNDKFTGELGFASGTYSGEGDGDQSHTTSWGLSYEHKFNNPFSAFVDYAGFTNTNGTVTYYNATEHQLMVGARIYFAPGTLFSNDRTGATLDLPTTLVRSFAWSEYNE